MELILSKQCESLTGALGRGFGYYIRRSRNARGEYRFFSQRSKHPPVPRDGHIRFISTCVWLIRDKFHITDIRVTAAELKEAYREAGYLAPAELKAMSDDAVLGAEETYSIVKEFLP